MDGPEPDDASTPGAAPSDERRMTAECDELLGHLYGIQREAFAQEKHEPVRPQAQAHCTSAGD